MGRKKGNGFIETFFLEKKGEEEIALMTRKTVLTFFLDQK
jgi:hypothetical protein